MLLHINGEQRDFPGGLTVAALVAQLGMKPDRVAVELNLEIVPRTQWDTTALNTGDKLEIVHFVGGGSTGLPKPSPQHVFITRSVFQKYLLSVIQKQAM